MKFTLIKIFAIIFLSSSLMSSSGFKKIEKIDDGCATDCNRMARLSVMLIAESHGVSPTGVYADYFMGLYRTSYNACYSSCN